MVVSITMVVEHQTQVCVQLFKHIVHILLVMWIANLADTSESIVHLLHGPLLVVYIGVMMRGRTVSSLAICRAMGGAKKAAAKPSHSFFKKNDGAAPAGDTALTTSAAADIDLDSAGAAAPTVAAEMHPPSAASASGASAPAASAQVAPADAAPAASSAPTAAVLGLQVPVVGAGVRRVAPSVTGTPEGKGNAFEFAEESEFSFAVAVQKAAAVKVKVEVEDDTDTTAGSSDAPPTIDSCRACSGEKSKGSPYCTKHKRSYQCLYNKCNRKNKAGELVDEDSANDFTLIFGKGRADPPNLTLANGVILDFTREFPEGKDVGKARGQNIISRYVNSIRLSNVKAEIDEDSMWDEEIFTNKFKALRGWSAAYSQQMFLELKNDKTIVQDMGGMGGTVRVAVPPSWTGESKRQSKREQSEDHTFERASKSSKMSAEEQQKYIDEMGSGFEKIDPNALHDKAWNTSLPANALTNVHGDDGSLSSVVDLVHSKANTLKRKNNPGSADDDTAEPSIVKAKVDSVAGAPSLPAPKVPKGGDGILLKRLQVKKKFDASIKDLRGKLEGSLKQAWVLMHTSDETEDEDLRKILTDRAQMAIHFIGTTPVDNRAEEGDEVTTMEQVILQPLLYDREATRACVRSLCLVVKIVCTRPRKYGHTFMHSFMIVSVPSCCIQSFQHCPVVYVMSRAFVAGEVGEVQLHQCVQGEEVFRGAR